MANKIKDYIVVAEGSTKRLQVTVNEYLEKKGYELYGYPFVFNGSIHQALIKVKPN